MARICVKRDSDGSTIDIEKQKAEQSDITARAQRIIPVDDSGSNIDVNNPLPVIISDGTDTADVIDTNGYKGVVALAPGHVSTDNSTSTILGSGVSFTGTFEDITNFGVIVISTKSNVSSATNGLMVQFSSDGTVGGIISEDEFTLPADTGKTWSFQAAARYYRVIYANGGTGQSNFILQTVLKPYYVKPSSHRIQDEINTEDDAELVKSVITGQKPNGDFVNFQGTAAGNFKVSIEEYDPISNPVRNDMEGGGKVAVGTTAVEVTFTGTPTSSIIIRSDRNNTGLLFIGESNVSSDGSNSLTYLEAGDSVTIDYDDADNAVYVVASVASQNFYKGALL